MPVNEDRIIGRDSFAIQDFFSKAGKVVDIYREGCYKWVRLGQFTSAILILSLERVKWKKTSVGSVGLGTWSRVAVGFPTAACRSQIAGQEITRRSIALPLDG